MENYECCIGLCVYNSSQGLPFVILNIKKIANCFKTTHVIFYYDESIDSTLNIITNFKHELNELNETFTVDIIVNKNIKTTIRTENISNARNEIRQKIIESYNTCDFFIMMDANEYSCIGEINIPVLQEVFEPAHLIKWDAVSFDREAGYYDTWALSFEDYIYSFFHFQHWKKVVELMRRDFNLLLQKHRETQDFIPVYSAFNGFAIYKTHKFIDCEYRNIIDHSLFPVHSINNQIKKMDCQIVNHCTNDTEHRHFHLQSIQKHNSKICIFPKFLFFKLPNPIIGLRGPA